MVPVVYCGCFGPSKDDDDHYVICNEEVEKLQSCNESLLKLKKACQKETPVGVDRPETSSDYVGHCLWAMDRIYGDRFPVGSDVMAEEARPGFFFKCLDEYPAHDEELYRFKYYECDKELDDARDAMSYVRDKCYEYCGHRKHCDCW